MLIVLTLSSRFLGFLMCSVLVVVRFTGTIRLRWKCLVVVVLSWTGGSSVSFLVIGSSWEFSVTWLCLVSVLILVRARTGWFLKGLI